MEVNEIIKTWVPRSRPRAIREHCTECAGGNPQEVTLCGLTDCPLWGFRFGGKPLGKSFIKRMEDARNKKEQEFDDAYAHLAEK